MIGYLIFYARALILATDTKLKCEKKLEFRSGIRENENLHSLYLRRSSAPEKRLRFPPTFNLF